MTVWSSGKSERLSNLSSLQKKPQVLAGRSSVNSKGHELAVRTASMRCSQCSTGICKRFVMVGSGSLSV